MLFERTYQNILSDGMNSLTNNTRVTRVSPGAKARALLEANARVSNRAYQTFDLNLALAFLTAANGRYLDFLGDLLNCPRQQATAAGAGADTQAVQFYVQTGTFGSINNGQNILIPNSTLVSTQSGDQGILYQVITPTILPAASSSVFVNVSAVLPGAASNVGAGQLIYTDFNNYTNAANNSLLVANNNSILTGSDIESDANYRFRIANQVLVGQAANETSVRLAALVVPGVSDIVLQPYINGIGTFGVLVKAVTPVVPPSLVAAVSAAVANVTSVGNVAYVQAPIQTGLAFNISLSYTSPLDSSTSATIVNNVITNLSNYVNGLNIGQEFVINQAADVVLSTDSRILDMGKPGTPFDAIYIYQQSSLQDNVVRSTLLQNYIPAVNEEVIIQPTLSTPIVITIDS